MGVLSYLFLLLLVPLIKGDYKTSPFIKFHLNQGLVLAIIWVALAILSQINSWIFWSSWSFGVYGFINIILWLLNLGTGILAIIGLIGAAQDKMNELPIIGKIKILK